MSSITAEQLASIKAANHIKSVAWETALFIPGDVVLGHGHTARRTAEGLWMDTLTGTEYTTLSRWIRHKLSRRSFNVKWGTFLMVGSTPIQMCRVPTPTERASYRPWTADGPWYLPSQILSAPAPAENNIIPMDTGNKNAIETLKSNLNSLMDRIVASERRINNLEERLLAVGALAAHIVLFKQRIEALENKTCNL